MTRGSGMTTSQITAAPAGAMYVAPHRGALSYVSALAAYLGRTDLSVVTPAIFDGDGMRLRGRDVEIVLDHATELTNRQLDCWHHFNERAKARKASVSTPL